MIVWGSVLQVILLLCPAIIPFIAFLVFRNIYDKQAELEEQSKHFMELFGPIEEATEPEATAQQLLNTGVVTAREARVLAGKVNCEYCNSTVDAGTNCPNCGAVLPEQEEAEYVELYADDEIVERVKISTTTGSI